MRKSLKENFLQPMILTDSLVKNDYRNDDLQLRKKYSSSS